MQIAIDNFLIAEKEGAEKYAPNTYVWAKQKIYGDKKIILQYPDNEEHTELAADDACAAAAKLLATVRRHARSGEMEFYDVLSKTNSTTGNKSDEEAIKSLVNEGGPVI